MEYELTHWEFSDIKDTKPKFEEGLCTIKIVDAEYLGETGEGSDKYTYNIIIESVEDGPSLGARVKLRYWMFNSKPGKEPELNKNVAGTLTSLGKALYGENVGVPAPVDLIGKIAVAQIKSKVVNGQTYVRVYQFEAASKDFEFMSDKPQYFRAPTPGGSA